MCKSDCYYSSLNFVWSNEQIFFLGGGFTPGLYSDNTRNITVLLTAVCCSDLCDFYNLQVCMGLIGLVVITKVSQVDTFAFQAIFCDNLFKTKSI